VEKSLIQGYIPPIYLITSRYNGIAQGSIILITMFKHLRLSRGRASAASDRVSISFFARLRVVSYHSSFGAPLSNLDSFREK